MKKIFFLFLTIALFNACENAQNATIEAGIPLDKVAPTDTNKGQIPADHPIMNMCIERENYTWRDIDRYYRTEMQQDKDKSYFKNVKNVAFNVLVTVFSLTEQAPPEVIAYYVEEQAAIDNTPFANEFVTCLKALKGYWPEAKITAVAQQRYEKTQAFYANSSIWQPRWEAHKSRFAVLLADDLK